jgi:hypothetical protein
MERVILFLMPYFLSVCPDLDVAHAEILETLASYGGRTRAEVLNASRIIAFSFSALDMLAEAKMTEMTVSMRLRYNGCANNLNRSCQQNENALAKRLDRDIPDAARPAEPVNDVPDTDFEDAIQHAEAKIAIQRNRSALPPSGILPSRPMAPAEREENNRQWGRAFVNILAEMGMPNGPDAPP